MIKKEVKKCNTKKANEQTGWQKDKTWKSLLSSTNID